MGKLLAGAGALTVFVAMSVIGLVFFGHTGSGWRARHEAFTGREPSILTK